ncbi:MAG: TfoX/Sxy family protein [Crocinitomicaceae bacterium]
MAIDSYFLERLQNALKSRGLDWDEKRMFGGICFMVHDKMCFGSFRNGLMVRVAPEEAEHLLQGEYTSQMMQAQRPMVGFLIVEMEGVDRESDLDFWIDKCLEYNPKAKASKKKK